MHAISRCVRTCHARDIAAMGRSYIRPISRLVGACHAREIAAMDRSYLWRIYLLEATPDPVQLQVAASARGHPLSETGRGIGSTLHVQRFLRVKVCGTKRYAQSRIRQRNVCGKHVQGNRPPHIFFLEFDALDQGWHNGERLQGRVEAATEWCLGQLQECNSCRCFFHPCV